MRIGVRRALFLFSTVAVVPALLFANTARAGDDAARALAERFAGGTGSQEQTDQQHKADEAEILQRARSEEATREALNKKAEAEAVARLNRATELKLQAEALRSAQKQLLVSQAAAPAAAPAASANDGPAAADTTTSAEQTASAAQERLDRAREASELSDKLKRARETRPAGAMGLGMSPGEGSPPAEPVTSAPAEAQEHRLPSLPREAVRNATSVTVLLVMDPGTTGIRTGNKTADPVICLDNWCYVSTGTETPAKVMTRGATLGPINSLGLRAGACRKSLTCIYRGLDIAAYFVAGAKPASVQPVDLRYLHHDRRQAIPLQVDNGCSAQRGEIRCARSLRGKGWIAWIIPENLAAEAGVEALQTALGAGLKTNADAVQAASLKTVR